MNVNSGKFTVDAGTGDTVVAGTLTSAGAINVGGGGINGVIGAGTRHQGSFTNVIASSIELKNGSTVQWLDEGTGSCNGTTIAFHHTAPGTPTVVASVLNGTNVSIIVTNITTNGFEATCSTPAVNAPTGTINYLDSPTTTASKTFVTSASIDSNAAPGANIRWVAMVR